MMDIASILKQSSLSHVSSLKHPQKLLSMRRTLLIRRLCKIIFFNASMFSSLVGVLGWPVLATSLTSSRPSLNLLCHNSTCVLLIVHTYINNWLLQPCSQDYGLASDTTHVVCVNFRHEWRDLQFKVDSKRQIF